MSDWDPGLYARFADLRFRPLLDLLARVPGELPAGDVVDLGCGTGVAAAVLRARFPGRRLVGLDASEAMLAGARAGGGYDALLCADAAGWRPEVPPALVFSNAALQWLPDHAGLFPRLAGLLAPGGVLAVQMPRQEGEPSHALLAATAGVLFPDRFPADPPPPRVAEAGWYRRLLGPSDVWETVYLQTLPPGGEGHPVRRFTESTAARPFLARMGAEEAAAFLAAYDAALAGPYPAGPDGTVIFPFRRLFLVLTRGRPGRPRADTGSSR